MKKLHSICTGSLALLMAVLVLACPVFASGEPSGDFSGEPRSLPSGEMAAGLSALASLSGEDIDKIGELVTEAANEGGADLTDIAALLDGVDTAELASQLRAVLDITQQLTDEALRDQIRLLAAEYGCSFTDEELDAIISVCRSLEPLTTQELQAKLAQVQEGVLAVEEIREGVASLGDRLQAFIRKLIELFQSILRRI